MLIPKADRKAIHEYLFKEGVLVAKKDYNLPKHGDIDTKNLYVRAARSMVQEHRLTKHQVIKACQSLTSRGFLKTRFSWQYYYYTLTPEGLEYLREWLHLPAEIVPATHIKQQRTHAPPRGMMGGDGGERRGGGRGGPRGDREGGYRRRDQGEPGKEGGAPGEFAPSFRGGFGRGRGAPPS
jgi:small subunit ribosomal protein S10e